MGLEWFHKSTINFILAIAIIIVGFIASFLLIIPSIGFSIILACLDVAFIVGLVLVKKETVEYREVEPEDKISSGA